jgi:hypothetical protein
LAVVFDEDIFAVHDKNFSFLGKWRRSKRCLENCPIKMFSES